MNMEKIKRENKKGFTLVELLIVMAIIGILIAIAIIGLGSAQATARNQARQTAVKGISGLLETYYGDAGGTYPSNIGIGINTAVAGSGNLEFQSPIDSSYFKTGTNLCKNVDAPENAAASSNFSLSACQVQNSPFTLTTTAATYTDSNTETYYFYIPFQNGNIGNTPGTPVSGYIIGACLENSGIFAYSSNGSNAPYTSNANSLSVGGTPKVTCG